MIPVPGLHKYTTLHPPVQNLLIDWQVCAACAEVPARHQEEAHSDRPQDPLQVYSHLVFISFICQLQDGHD